jgi:hypothetical protein
LQRQWVADDLETFARFQQGRESEGAWSDAVPYSRGEIHVTLDELGSFFDEYLALLRRYQRSPDERAAGARTVLTRFIGFPDPREGGTAASQ